MSIVYAETLPTKILGRVRFGFDAEGCLLEVKMRADSRSGARGKAPVTVPSRLQLERWLQAYVVGNAPPFPGKWEMPGSTEFARAVYAVVAAIKVGQTLSYGEVAALAGAPNAFRAVGTAMGRNPISLVVP